MSRDHVLWSDGRCDFHFQNLHYLTLTGIWKILTWIRKAILFFPCMYNSTLLSITSEYRLFSVFLNAGDQLQGKTLEWGRRAFCCSLWMAFGLLDIMCKANKGIAFARTTHSHLVSFALILRYVVWWVLVFKYQPALAFCKPRSIFGWLHSLANSRHLSSSAATEGWIMMKIILSSFSLS